jgi:hypothetical protein
LRLPAFRNPFGSSGTQTDALVPSIFSVAIAGRRRRAIFGNGSNSGTAASISFMPERCR